MAWAMLLLAVGFEISAAIQLKFSNGFTKMDSSVYTVILFALSFTCAAIAFKKIDLGLGYALWSSLGTVGIIAAGILLFDEPANLFKIGCVSLILVGVIGLKIYS